MAWYINTHLIPLIKRGVLIIVCAIGIVMALHNIGVTVTTLMGALGIGGMALIAGGYTAPN